MKSLIVLNKAPIPTQTFALPVHITTTKPSSTPSMSAMDPVKIPDYEPTTSFLESPAIKTIYIVEYVLNQPTAGTPQPEASAKPPRRPFETGLTPMESSADTSVPPPRPRTDNSSISNKNSNSTIYSSNQAPPTHYWMPRSIRGVLIKVIEYMFMTFPGIALAFGLIAWFQIAYSRYLRKLPTAGDFKFMELRLASHGKDRELEKLQLLLEIKEKGSNRAIKAAEAAVAAKEISDQKAADEIARLQSIVEKADRALIQEQGASKQKLTEAAKEHARLLKESVEKVKENSKKAIQMAKDNGIHEATRLTDLADQKNVETTQRRKADKVTIDGLKKQSATDAKTVLELTNKVGSIAEKDKTIVIMAAETRNLTKIVKDLTKERDRALKDGVDAAIADKAKIAQLNTQVIEANKHRKAAEEKALKQEALVAKVTEQLQVAEEEARKQKTNAAEAEASCKFAEENASREEVKVTEAAEQLARMGISLDQAKLDTQEARAKADEDKKALRERITELEGQHQGEPVGLDTPAPSSDQSSQELSMPQQQRPVVRFPVCPASKSHTRSLTDQRSSGSQQGPRQGPACAAYNKPLPRCLPPAKTKTPPEERGLPADTPTGPKSGRGGGRRGGC